MAEYIDRAVYLSVLRAKANMAVLMDAAPYFEKAAQMLEKLPAADVAPVVHGRCPICSGRKILTQDCDNGYSVEVDAEQGEMSIWQGDTCLTVISIDYCPNCGAKMDGGESDDD